MNKRDKKGLGLSVREYLGLPWERGEFDCWGLVRLVYACELNITLPLVFVDAGNYRDVVRAFKGHAVKQYFKKIEQPTNFCVVGICEGDELSHCGVYLDTNDGPRILHNIKDDGVVCQALSELKLYGFSIEGFYRYDR